MNTCPKCNTNLEGFEIFCPNCGENVAEANQTDNTNFENETLLQDYHQQETQTSPIDIMLRVALSVSVIISFIGFIILCGGFNRANYDINSDTVTTGYSYYGGDAYTGMQHASADAANNAAAAVEALDAINNNIIKSEASGNRTRGILIFAIGIISSFYFGLNLKIHHDTNNKNCDMLSSDSYSYANKPYGENADSQPDGESEADDTLINQSLNEEDIKL